MSAHPPDRASSVTWPLFVRAALFFALVPGFGLGAALFAERTWGDGIGAWWPAAAQAHGHAQLFGWIVLMVLGTALHFLPRLAGLDAVDGTLPRVAFGCLFIGLTLRVVIQPVASESQSMAFLALLVVSGVLELAGIMIAVRLLIAIGVGLASRVKSGAVRVTAPYVMVALTGLLSVSVLNLLGLVQLARTDELLLPQRYAETSIALGFHAFLLPAAIMMTLRLFPLYVQTMPSRPRTLLLVLGVLLIGLVARIWGDTAGVDSVAGAGRVVQSLAIVACVYATGVFGMKRPLPRKQRHPLTDPVRLMMMGAYVWLVVAAALLFIGGLGLISGDPVTRFGDLENHSLGAGFATLLIFGSGSHLFPGFLRQKVRSERLSWAILVCASVAAILRIVPVLLTADSGGWPAVAGVAGGLAVILFGINIRWATSASR